MPGGEHSTPQRPHHVLVVAADRKPPGRHEERHGYRGHDHVADPGVGAGLGRRVCRAGIPRRFRPIRISPARAAAASTGPSTGNTPVGRPATPRSVLATASTPTPVMKHNATRGGSGNPTRRASGQTWTAPTRTRTRSAAASRSRSITAVVPGRPRAWATNGRPPRPVGEPGPGRSASGPPPRTRWVWERAGTAARTPAPSTPATPRTGAGWSRTGPSPEPRTAPDHRPVPAPTRTG